MLLRFRVWILLQAITSGALGIATARAENTRDLSIATGTVSIFATVVSFIAMCIAFDYSREHLDVYWVVSITIP